eukprot:729234-Lingulodinium_polyedra.AAC.1
MQVWPRRVRELAEARSLVVQPRYRCLQHSEPAPLALRHVLLQRSGQLLQLTGQALASADRHLVELVPLLAIANVKIEVRVHPALGRPALEHHGPPAQKPQVSPGHVLLVADEVAHAARQQQGVQLCEVHPWQRVAERGRRC